MKIDQTNNNPLIRNTFEKLPSVKNEKAVPEETPVKTGDKIEISSEAKMLISNNVSAKDLQSVKEKINSNFYNSDTVIQKVADAIMKEITNTKMETDNGDHSN